MNGLRPSAAEIRPDGLAAGLAGHCQLDKKIQSQKEKEVICRSASRKTISHPQQHVVKIGSSHVSIVNCISPSKISKLFCKFPSH